MSNNMDNQTTFLSLDLTDISQIACLIKEACPKEETMARKSKQSASSINIKYSSATGELVIDGQSMGVFEDDEGNHPTLREMQEFIAAVQKRLPFDSRLVDNNSKGGVSS